MDTGFLNAREVTLPSEPVKDPACWKGADFQNSTDWQYRLDAADLSEIAAAIKRVKDKGLSIMEVTQNDFPLDRLARTMADIRKELLEGRGFALLRGLPVDDLSREEIALVYWGLGTYIGYAVPQNGRGQILVHVLDKGGRTDAAYTEQSSLGEKNAFLNPKQRAYYSNQRLFYHVDWADIIGLLCLHPAMTGGESRFVSSIALHNAIMERRPDLLRTLYEPYWVDRKGEIPACSRPYFQMPVFHHYQGKLTTYHPGGHIKTTDIYPELPPLTSKQLEAMEFMNDLANSPEFCMLNIFDKGDIQFLNNHVVLHSRTAFLDHPEPEKRRHLWRMWWVTPDGRPLPHWYYLRYGEGRRGGIFTPGTAENLPIEIPES